MFRLYLCVLYRLCYTFVPDGTHLDMFHDGRDQHVTERQSRVHPPTLLSCLNG